MSLPLSAWLKTPVVLTQEWAELATTPNDCTTGTRRGHNRAGDTCLGGARCWGSGQQPGGTMGGPRTVC